MRKAIKQNIIVPADTPRTEGEKKRKIRKASRGRVEKMLSLNALTPKEEAFCTLYAGDREFFMNGTQSYIEAFDITVGKDKSRGEVSYDAVRARAYELLTKPHILDQINRLYETRGMNDVFVDKQIEMLVTQNADFRAKISAIQEYNKLRQRITQKSQVHTRHEMLGIVRHIYEEADRIDEENKGKAVGYK